MSRVRSALVLSVLLLGVAAPAAGAGRVRPTLGARSYPGPGFGGAMPGFGTAAPKVLNANGDPNSVVSGIRWVNWGAREAKGFGSSAEFSPHGGYLPGLFPVQLRATDLGRCRANGPLVYRRLWRRDRTEGGSAWSAWVQWPDLTYPRPQLLC